MSSAKRGPKSPAEKLLYLERLETIKRLWVRGTPQHEIAQQLDIGERTVRSDLAAVRRMIGKAIADDEGKARIWKEITRLDECERESWLAWERSKQDAELLSAKTVKTAAGERTEASKRTEGQAGDPRFLAEIRACVRQRCELLGLIVRKVAPTSPDGKEAATVLVYLPDNGREPGRAVVE